MLLMLAVLSSGCTLLQGAGKEADRRSETDLETLRVLISSDIHYTDQMRTYGIDMDKRMQHWVDSILAEHEKEPIDLLVLNGDVSEDHWDHSQWDSVNGSCVLCGMDSTIPNLVDRYLNTLKQYFPVFVMPGNHEQYTNDEWKELVGNNRQDSMVIDNTLFLFMDNFRVTAVPAECSDGTYTPTDVDYINEMIATYPEHDTYIISHYIDPRAESQNFRKLIVENERIKGMFSGHTHDSQLIELGEYWGNKTIAQTGHFSAYFSTSTEKAFWGFRELVITPEEAYSQYITVKSDAIIDGQEQHFERTTKNLVQYE